MGGITDDVSNDVNNDLDDVNNDWAMDYAAVTKESVRFWTNVTIFSKSWSEIWVEMRKMWEIRVAM